MDGHVKLMLVRCVRFASPRFTPLAAARAPVPSSVWKFDIRSRPARRACPTRWTLTRILSSPGAQPEVESSDDEEDAWAKWEAKNHEQRERRRLMGELRGARSLASETSRAVRDARSRSRSPDPPRAADAVRARSATRFTPSSSTDATRTPSAFARRASGSTSTMPRSSSGRNPRSPDRAPARDGPRDARDRPRVFAPSPRPGTHPETRPRPRTTTRATTRGEGGRRRAARRFARRSVANSRRRVDLSLGRRARRRIARLAARRPEPPVRVPSPRDAVVPRLDTGSTTTTATRLRSGATSRTRLRRRARGAASSRLGTPRRPPPRSIPLDCSRRVVRWNARATGARWNARGVARSSRSRW